MIELVLTRQTVIILGIAASIFVVMGSWMKFKYGGEQKKTPMRIIYTGYILFFLSIVIYIILGFIDSR